MIFVFYFFAAVLAWLSFKSLRGGIAYLKFFRSELGKPPSEFKPFVSLIAPCRGLDSGLEQNLTALIEQDYPAYEVIFVVDDADDAAVVTIEKVIKAETRPVGSVLIVAPEAHNCSQKVENFLREAVLHTAPRIGSFRFRRFRCKTFEKLACFSAPLLCVDKNVGAATGYRWFISKNPTFGSEMRSAWNASIASALGPNSRSNFCWGGSMAIRRDVFEAVNMREKWLGTLSDDFARHSRIE